MKYQRASNQLRALFMLYISVIFLSSYSLVGKLLLLLFRGCTAVFISAIFLRVCALMADCNQINSSAEWFSLSFNLQVYFFICSQSSYFSTTATLWALISLLISFILLALAINSFLTPSQTSQAVLNYCLVLASCLQRVCQVGSDAVARWTRFSCSCFFCAQRITPLSNALESLAQRECIYFWQISSSYCSFKHPYTPLSEIALLFYFSRVVDLLLIIFLISIKIKVLKLMAQSNNQVEALPRKFPKTIVKEVDQIPIAIPCIPCLGQYNWSGMTSIQLYLMQRLSLLAEQIVEKNTITITDSRTGKTHELNANRSFVKSSDLSKLTHKGKVLRGYDPGYMNTITCTSTISFIDGDRGILEYRGYPIEVLAEKCTFLEVAYLVLWGELPTQKELGGFTKKVMEHTFVHEDLLSMMNSFRYDAHPMGMLCSAVAALSTLHPEQNPSLVGESVYKNKKVRNKQIYRLLGGVPTIAANAYRHRIGREYNKPHENAGYVENFLFMLDKLNEGDFKPHPKLVRALEVLFILHAEHELNCSTAAVRHLSSSGVDIYTSIAGATGALYGGKHGGANEAVLRMLESIGKKSNIPQFIEDVKNKKGLLYGFGHRVYKNYDPRAKIVKRIAEEVFEITGKQELIEIAVQLERIALSDPYFIERKLYPNVDFYSGIIYRAMGFPTDMFPVLFMIPRVVGWLAHWNEFLDDPENKIVRPRQHYVGHNTRDYVPVEKRSETNFNIDCNQTSFYKRSIVSNSIK